MNWLNNTSIHIAFTDKTINYRMTVSAIEVKIGFMLYRIFDQSYILNISLVSDDQISYFFHLNWVLFIMNNILQEFLDNLISRHKYGYLKNFQQFSDPIFIVLVLLI